MMYSPDSRKSTFSNDIIKKQMGFVLQSESKKKTLEEIQNDIFNFLDKKLKLNDTQIVDWVHEQEYQLDGIKIFDEKTQIQVDEMRVFLNNLKEKYSKKSNDRNDYVYLELKDLYEQEKTDKIELQQKFQSIIDDLREQLELKNEKIKSIETVLEHKNEQVKELKQTQKKQFEDLQLQNQEVIKINQQKTEKLLEIQNYQDSDRNQQEQINQFIDENNELNENLNDARNQLQDYKMQQDQNLQYINELEENINYIKYQEKMLKDLNQKMQSKVEILQNEQIQNLQMLEDNLKDLQQRCKHYQKENYRQKQIIDKQNHNLKELLEYQEKLLSLNKQYTYDNEQLIQMNKDIEDKLDGYSIMISQKKRY